MKKIIDHLTADPWYQMVNHTQCFLTDPVRAIPDKQTVLSVLPIASSHICRFGGHLKHFYSLAQHALNVSLRVEALGGSPRHCLQAILHDGAEAFLGGDIPTPVRKMIRGYDELENRFLDRIMELFRISTELYTIVKQADREMLVLEAERGLVGGPLGDWTYLYLDKRVSRERISKSLTEFYSDALDPQCCSIAENRFRNRLEQLKNA